MAALVAAAVPASAQIAFQSKEYIGFVPAAVTTDNSPSVYTVDEDNNSIEIFDASLNRIKSFHPNLSLKTSRTLKESCSNAENVKISNCRLYERGNLTVYDEAKHEYVTISATSIDDMITKLKLNLGKDFYKITLNDIPGVYNGWQFCAIGEDGIIKQYAFEASASAEFEFEDESALTWALVEESSYEYPAKLEYFYYYNYDNSSYLENGFHVFQSLYNNDSKWEYVTAKYGVEELYERYYVSGSQDFDETGHRIIERTSKYRNQMIGYSITNEDGVEVGFIAKPENCKDNFSIGSIYVFGNKKYVKAEGEVYDGDGIYYYYQYLFDLDNLGGAALVVERKDNMRVVSQGDVVEIILPKNAANGEVGIVGMNGQTLGRQKVSDGQSRAQFNSANLAKGVYNATFTHKNGKRESQKFVVK